MSLATRADYIAEFGESEIVARCDRDGDGIEDAGVFDAQLLSAEAEVQGYVNARPQGQAAPDAGLLKRVTLDVLRYLLYRRRMDPDVLSAYEKAVSLLRAIASGRIAPAGGNGSATAPVITADDVQFDAPERVFDRSTLSDF